MFRMLIILASVLSMSMTALAQDIVSDTGSPASTLKVYRSETFGALQPQGWWLLVGVSGGVFNFNNADDVSAGSSLQVRASGDYYFDGAPWVAEGSLGLATNEMGKDGPNDTYMSGLVSAALRFQTPNRWQLGPELNTLIGNGKQYNATTNAIASFLGLGIYREFSIQDSTIGRVGVRAMTDLNSRDGTTQLFLFDFQMGFPFRTRSDVEEPVVVNELPPAKTQMVNQVYAASLPLNNDVTYNVGHAWPAQQDESRIKNLANMLSENQDLFTSIEVQGTSNWNGKPNTRRILSHARSQGVLRLLAEAGIPASKIDARAQNLPQAIGVQTETERRVDLIFHGVTDTERLKEIFQRASR